MNKEAKQMELHEHNLDKNKVRGKELLWSIEESHLKIMKIAAAIINGETERETTEGVVEEKLSKPKKRQSQIKKQKTMSCYDDSGICMDEEQCEKKKISKRASRKSMSNCNDEVCMGQEVQPKKRKNTKPVLNRSVSICNGECMDQEVQSKKIKNSKCVLRKSESTCMDNGVCIGEKVQAKKNTNARSAPRKRIKSVSVCNNDGLCWKEVKPKKRKSTKSDSRKSVDKCNSAGACMVEEVQSKKKKNTKSISSVNDEIPDNKTKTKRKLYTSGDKLTASKQVLTDIRKRIKNITSKTKKDNSKKCQSAENPQHEFNDF